MYKSLFFSSEWYFYTRKENIDKTLDVQFWIILIHAVKIWDHLNENLSSISITKCQFFWNALYNNYFI